VALVWDMNAQLTSKLLYGKAFRAPSFNEQYSQNNPVLVGNKNLTPEITNNIELVFDYHPTPRLRTALNLYAYEINGLIVPLPDAGKTTAPFKNFGDHHGYGGELEWDWKLYEKWQLSGNYAWQQAYKEDTNESVTGVPEHHVYVALDWQVSQQWHLRPQVNWIAGRQNAANDNRPLNDYASMDLTLRGKKLFNYLNVTASLHNVFDSINREPAEFTFSQNLPLAGRSFYLETSINF
jgi:iron complex outermembrane receptor protein